jgi:hypothetical protein
MTALTSSLSLLQASLQQYRSGTTYFLADVYDNQPPGSLSQTSFYPLLGTNLRLPPAGLQVTNGTLTPADDGTQLILTGQASVLGMTDAPITITFSDTTGPSFDPSQNPSANNLNTLDLIGLTMTAAITPPAGWSLGSSFPDLQGTFFDLFPVSEATLWVSSNDLPNVVPGQLVEAGLSVGVTFGVTDDLRKAASRVRLGGSLRFYGPIAWTTDPTPVSLAALASQPIGVKDEEVVIELLAQWAGPGKITTSIEIRAESEAVRPSAAALPSSTPPGTIQAYPLWAGVAEGADRHSLRAAGDALLQDRVLPARLELLDPRQAPGGAHGDRDPMDSGRS